MLGQVCCDSNGKLNAQSVLLEAGPEQGGQQVPVDLSELKEYSLFPGQVWLVFGGIFFIYFWTEITQWWVLLCLSTEVSVQQVISPPRTTE